MNEKTKTIVKAENILDQLENIRLYMQTIEQAGNALVFAKKLKMFAAQVEEKVKTRAGEIMRDEDVNLIEAEGFLIQSIPPTETIEYSAPSIIDILGYDRARGLGLKISTAKVKDYIRKRGVSDLELAEINKHQKTKHRDGYIMIKEMKVKETK